MSVSVGTTAGNQVTVTIDGRTLLSFTTEESSVNVVNGGTTSVTVTERGAKGDTGETGATGATGATGPGVASGGTENEFLQKNSGTDYDTKWSAYTLPGADGTDGQVLTTDGAGTVSFAFPQTIAENVKNVSGGPLSKGTPVHVTGSVGNLAEVIAADAATNYPAHFVLNEDLADDGEGLGIALGFINNVDVPDASIYTEGQTVYLGETPGTFTTTKPTGTNAIQNLGIIIKVNTSGNKISGIVMGAGRSNDVPNIPNGQAWIGNASGVATPTTLATVATTGAYSDLSGTPTIPSGDLVDDTTPQLGGDLDVNGNKITSASNGDITIDPDGTGAIILKSDDIQFDGGGTFAGKIKLYESDILGANFIALSAPLSVTSDTTLTLPDGAGTSGQALTTNGLGTLSWADVIGPNSPTVNGVLSVEEGGADTGRIALYDIDGSNYVLVKAPDVISSNVTFVLPAADGSSGQVLKTDGSGNLSFVDQTADTDTYLGSTDQTLSANRVVEMNGNTLDFQNGSTSQIKFFSAGTVQMNNRLTIDGDTANASIRMFDNGNSNAVTINTSGSMSGNVSITLPTTNLNFPTSAGSSGQFMQTDGSGNLSFATPSVNTNVGPWVNLGGRYQIDTADANNMLISGGAFGPYYYIWSQSAGTTVSGGTVDTTTTTMSSFYQLYGGFQLPDNLKVKANFALRNANSNSYSKPIRFQIWSFPLESVSSTVTMTLRADYTFNTPGNTYPADHTVTTTSALTADEYIVCMFAVDNATMTSTGYVYCNIQLELVE